MRKSDEPEVPRPAKLKGVERVVALEQGLLAQGSSSTTCLRYQRCSMPKIFLLSTVKRQVESLDAWRAATPRVGDVKS
eukprot:g65299.t1